MLISQLKDAFIGAAIGDALGVPGEFKSRSYFQKSPITDYQSGGVHNQPKGTWSDDTSLLCYTILSLTNGYDLEDIGQNFKDWLKYQEWTAWHEIFDIGITTKSSIHRILRGESAKFSGEFDIHSNGNGSLMRIFPLVSYTRSFSIEDRYQIIKEVSSITHAHFRSCFSCFIYSELFLELLKGNDKEVAYENCKASVLNYTSTQDFNKNELTLFDRVLTQDIRKIPLSNIKSTGYVIHALETALWCFLNHSSYSDCTLSAINLGEDTDTNGAITGALAGFYYTESIPTKWKENLVRYNDLDKLAQTWIDSLS